MLYVKDRGTQEFQADMRGKKAADVYRITSWGEEDEETIFCDWDDHGIAACWMF